MAHILALGGRYVKCNIALHFPGEQNKNIMAASGPAARGPAERVDNADRARIVLAGAGPGTTVAIKLSERSVS